MNGYPRFGWVDIDRFLQYYTPIRVGVVGDEVRILSAKTQYGWINCGAIANDVGAWDAEEIRDNFNYKAYTTIYGTIYF